MFSQAWGYLWGQLQTLLGAQGPAQDLACPHCLLAAGLPLLPATRLMCHALVSKLSQTSPFLTGLPPSSTVNGDPPGYCNFSVGSWIGGGHEVGMFQAVE